MNRIFSQFDFTDYWTLVVFPVFPLACWLIFFWLLWRRRKPIACEQRSEVPWGAIDVIFILGSMLLAKFIAQFCAMILISQKTGIPLDQIKAQTAIENANLFVGSNIVFSLLQLAFAIWYLRQTQNSQWSDLGLSLTNWKRYLAIGLTASVMIIPLVLLVNIVLHYVLQVQYSHQVMDMVRYALLISAVSTVLVAPLVEEFHFRVVLQGFLQRVYGLDLEKKVRLIQGDVRTEKLADQSQSRDKKSKQQPKSSSTDQARVPWWPILVSSLLFASVHLGQGAAPYALFVFALFLGFLYRQTSSLIPCVIVHLLLNFWSFVALVYSLD